MPIRKPDLNVRFVIDIEPIGFFDCKVPKHKKSSRAWARQYRRHIDRSLRSTLGVGEYSKGVRVYMVDADTGERIS